LHAHLENFAPSHGSAIVIEIAGSEEKIQAFLPILDEMVEGDLVTTEKMQALHYRGIEGMIARCRLTNSSPSAR
jgi:PII-like signaling protein